MEITQEKFKQTDVKLAGQFVVESMSSDIGYSPRYDFSEEGSISNIQQRFAHYCLMAKSNLVMDSFGQGQPSIAALKKYIRDYAFEPSNRTNDAMEYLYESDDKEELVNQISMLSLYANLKRVKNISSLSLREIASALNPEQVALAIGLYTYFTVVVNDNVTAKDFNELFIEAWVAYFDVFSLRLEYLKMKRYNWKEDFKGALLADD